MKSNITPLIRSWIVLLTIVSVSSTLLSVTQFYLKRSNSQKVYQSPPPVFQGVPADVTVSCQSIPTVPNVTATSPGCPGNVSIAFNESRGASTCQHSYQLIRTWVATDNCGSKATATQVITVEDKTAPMLIPKLALLNNYQNLDTIFADCDNPLLLGVGDFTAMDNCDSNPTITFIDTAVHKGTCLPQGYTSVLYCAWFATDDCGNQSSFTIFMVTVDKKAPTLFGVPADLTASCDNIPNVPNTVTAKDNCDTNPTVTFRQDITATACSGTYTISRIWTATDKCGNVSSKTQVISVYDNTPPTLVGVPTNITVDLDKGESVPSPANVTANDACDSKPTVLFSEVKVDVGCGYTLTRTWTAIDACGNKSAPQSQTITVLKSCSCTPPTVSGDVTNTTCGNNNGKIVVTVSPAGSYNFAWSSGNSSSNTVDNLSAGMYSVTVSAQNDPNCKAVAHFVVNNTDGPQVEAQVGNTTCGQSNGFIHLTPTSFTFIWNDGNTSANRDDLASGQYVVTITESGNTCATIKMFTVQSSTINGTADIKINTVNSPTCPGLANGSVDYTVTTTGQLNLPLSEVILDANNNSVNKNNLKKGSYCIEVREAGGCLLTRTCFEVTDPLGITANYVVQHYTCNQKGSITLSVGGGTQPYNFDWADINGNSNDQDRKDLVSGTYSVTISDNNNCTYALNSITVLDSCYTCEAPVITSALIMEEHCNKGDGMIAITVSSKNPVSYTWSPNVSQNGTASNLSAGTYQVTISEVNSSTCSITRSFTLGNVNAPNITKEIRSAICGKANGLAELSPASGITYQWSDGGSGNRRDNLLPGTYQITATDIENPNCKQFLTIAIPNQNDLTASANNIVNASCGQANGSATIVVSNGSGNYTYSWGNSATKSDLAAGTYRVTVEDTVNGCTAVATVIIESEGAVASIEGLKDEYAVNCKGDKNLSVSFTITKGNPFVGTEKVVIKNTQTGNEVENGKIGAGNYCIEVSDETGCKAAIKCFTVREPNMLQVDITTLNPTCDHQGSIKLVTQGGNGSYNYDWADLAGNTDPKDRLDIVEGTYQVTITDIKGCSLISPEITLKKDCNTGGSTIDTIYHTMNITTKDTICPTLPNGFNAVSYVLIGNATNGQSNYGTWTLLSNGCLEYTSKNNTGNNVDIICIEATDGQGKKDTTCIVISIKDSNTSCQINYNIVVKEASCGKEDGSIQIETSSSYTYTWSPNVSSSKIANNLKAGVYIVSIKDNTIAGCELQDTIVVRNQDGPVIGEIQTKAATCGQSNGEAKLLPENYTYLWSDGGTGNSRNNLKGQTYYVTVTDPAKPNCPQFVTVSIGVSSDLTATVGNVQKAACGQSNGAATITISNGSGNYTYSWGSSATRTDLTAGLHNVTVTDTESGCKVVVNVVIESEGAVATIEGLNDTYSVSCKGDKNLTVSFTVTKGTPFAGTEKVVIKNAAGAVVENGKIGAGNYCVEVSDETGCLAAMKCFEVTEPQLIQLNIAVVQPTCTNQGSINLTTTGGNGSYIYNWADLAGANDPEDRTDIGEGSYQVTVSDSKGCSLISPEITLKKDCNTSSTIDTIYHTMNITAKDTICPTLPNGFNAVRFVLIGNANIGQSIFGTWTILSNGCLEYTSKNITGNNVDIICIEATDAQGNKDTTCIVISIKDPTLCNFNINNIVKETTCGKSDGSISISANSANYSYSWTPNVSTTNSAKNLASGVYIIEIKDNENTNCTYLDTVIVKNQDGPVVAEIQTKAATCGQSNGEATLSPSIFTYTWSDGGTGATRTNLKAQSYFVTVTDAGCSNIYLITIGESSVLEANTTILKNADCKQKNGSVEISVSNGSGNYEYNWSSIGIAPNKLDTLSAGFYTVTVTDKENNCKKVVSFNLNNTVTGNATINADSVYYLKCGENTLSASFTVETQAGFLLPYTVRVIDINGNQVSANSLKAGFYTIQVFDDEECLAVSKTIEVKASTPLKVDVQAYPQLCQPTGSITVTVTNGNGSEQFIWADIQGNTTTKDRTNLASGYYSLTVVDSKSCSVSIDSIFVGKNCNGPITPDTVKVSTPESTAVTICYKPDQLNGKIISSDICGLPTNGTFTLTDSCLTYIPNPGFVNLTDKMCVVFCDDLGVCDTVYYCIYVYPYNCNPILASSTVIQAHCGKNDGTIILNIAPTVAQLKYDWSPNVSTTNIADNVSAGTYSVTISDINYPRCSTILNIVVGNADGPVATVDSLGDAYCSSANGYARLLPANFNYTWSNGSSGNVQNNLTAGTYQITVSDPADPNCINVKELRIGRFSDLIATVRVDKNPDCGRSNGKATILVSNGSNNLTFSWGQDTKDSLPAGPYTVFVNDLESGCITAVNFVLINAVAGGATITADSIVKLKCVGDADGKLNFTVLKDPTFVGKDSTFIVDSTGRIRNNGRLTAGDYCLIVLDSIGCYTGSHCFKVVAPEPIKLDVAVINKNCTEKGSIVTTTNGGTPPYSYLWNDLSVNPQPKDRTDLEAGKYSLTVTDSVGCSLSVQNIEIKDICKPLKIDTIRIDLPNGKNDTIVCLPTIELTGALDSVFICGNSKHGALIVNPLDTCVQYISDSTYTNGCDTMCVKVCDKNGVCDTTIIIVCKGNVVICNNYFGTDTVSVTARTCDSLVNYCLPFTVLDIPKFKIFDNGSPYSNGFAGCNFDTLILYQYKVVPGEGKEGPYDLMYWAIGTDTFRGRINDVFGLLDSMKIWDPKGSWYIDTITKNIKGGEIGKQYGNMLINQVGTTGTATLIPNIDYKSNNIALKLKPGYHDVIFNDTTTNCSDTLKVKVIPKVYDGPPVIFIQKCDSVATICIGIDPKEIFNYAILVNGIPYLGKIDSCPFTPTILGTSIQLDTGIYVIEFRNILTGCSAKDSLTVSCQPINPPTPNLVDTCIIERDSVLFCFNAVGIDPTTIKNLCPEKADGDVSIEVITQGANICIKAKGVHLGADTFCMTKCNIGGVCDTVTYIVCVKPRIDTIRKQIKLSFMDTICLDTAILKGGVGSITNICPSKSGINVQVDTIGLTGCLKLTADGVGQDTACLVICDKTGQYCDTTILIINVVPPTPDTIRRMIMVGQMDSVCLDTTELMPPILSIKNFCENNASQAVDFVLPSGSPWCVKFTGKSEGKDTACLVICNQITCDTTILIVMVTKDTLTKLPPVAVVDSATTSFGDPVRVMVLMNDTINGTLVDWGVVMQPRNGTVAKDPSDSTKLIYTPKVNTCGRDSFSYYIANEVGYDTAYVFIDVKCDTFIIFNGLSPNGDDENDGFIIIGIENYPENNVDIYNRWGHLVYCKKGYSNATAWKGEWQEKYVPDGTYFYVINLGSSGGNKIYTGYIEVRR